MARRTFSSRNPRTFPSHLQRAQTTNKSLRKELREYHEIGEARRLTRRVHLISTSWHRSKRSHRPPPPLRSPFLRDRSRDLVQSVPEGIYELSIRHCAQCAHEATNDLALRWYISEHNDVRFGVGENTDPAVEDTSLFARRSHTR